MRSGVDIGEWWLRTFIGIAFIAFFIGLLWLYGWAKEPTRKLIQAALVGGAPPSIITQINNENTDFAHAIALASPYLTKQQVAEFSGIKPTPATPPTPIRDRLQTHLTEVALAKGSLPPSVVLDKILDVGDALWEPKATDTDFAGLAASLSAYVTALPPFEPSSFTQPLSAAVNIAQLSYEMVEPLRATSLKNIPDRFHEATWRVTMQQTNGKGGNPVYPQNYKGPKEQIAKEYFANTLFYDLLTLPVPFPLFDKTRFDSHHVVGPKDTGKTTLLSHLIAYDIERPVSVVVIDSQFRMIDSFARLPNCNPILVSPTNPIPLNPFKWSNIDDTVDILTYAFGAIFETELTQLQGAPLEYIIRAVAQDPKANLDTLTDFIITPRQDLIAKTDETTQKYFKNFYKDTGKATRAGLVTKMMAFRKHKAVDQMLNADSNELNLPKLLQEGRVVLVDTNKNDFTSDQTRVFGRLFIALLHNVMRKRIKVVDESTLRPTFVYIDELQDYCALNNDDEKLRELLDQGRKQKVGFILAHQRENQINSSVLAALRDSAIKTTCVGRGVADFTIHNKTSRLAIPEYKPAGTISSQEFQSRYSRTIPETKRDMPDLPDVV